MSTEFDPYHRWLGIRPKDQPADHYRLLGLSRFEDDPEVIRDAAERQIAHVRRYALGQHQAISQKILNELAAAKACLLNPDKKHAYDGTLRQAEASAVETRQSPTTVVPERQEAEDTAAPDAPPASEPPVVAERGVPIAGPAVAEPPESENRADWDTSVAAALTAVAPAGPGSATRSSGKAVRGRGGTKTSRLPIPSTALLVVGLAAGVLVLLAIVSGVFDGAKRGDANKERGATAKAPTGSSNAAPGEPKSAVPRVTPRPEKPTAKPPADKPRSEKPAADLGKQTKAEAKPEPLEPKPALSKMPSPPPLAVAPFSKPHSPVETKRSSDGPTDIGLAMATQKARLADSGIGLGDNNRAMPFTGDAILTHQKTGNGVVRMWSVGADGAIARVRDIVSPDKTHGSSTFGDSILVAGNFLGIGSGNTWVNGAHDGQFYTYDLSTGTKLSQFNPSPHWAQYFGCSAALSRDGYYVVAESGNKDWGTDAAITVYAYDPVTSSSKFIGREVVESSFSAVSPVGTSGPLVVSHYYVGNTKSHVTQTWKVTRSDRGLWSFAKLGSFSPAGDDPIDPASLPAWRTKAVTNGTLVGLAQAYLDGGGKVQLFHSRPDGSLLFLKTIDAPPAADGDYGWSALFDGDRLYVGAPNATVDDQQTGCVFVYDTSAAITTGETPLVDTIVPTAPAPGEHFGGAMGIANGRLLVSAGADVAYLFDALGHAKTVREHGSRSAPRP